jgi:hypothetical protein
MNKPIPEDCLRIHNVAIASHVFESRAVREGRDQIMKNFQKFVITPLACSRRNQSNSMKNSDLEKSVMIRSFHPLTAQRSEDVRCNCYLVYKVAICRDGCIH